MPAKRKIHCLENDSVSNYITHTHTHAEHTHTYAHTCRTHTQIHTQVRTYRYRTYARTDTEHTHTLIHTHTHTNDIHTNTFVSHMLYLSYCCFSLVFCSCLPSEDNLFTSKVSVMLFCNSRLMICRGAASH